ncbi:MAG TPA: hypothetical protein VHX17_14045 [Candidatus Cybelea sp.]|nr:hypothetical protein [Candidatus Cybelea sp.]
MTVRERAGEYGVAVRFVDLGDWGESELRSEYDPALREIRVHFKLAPELIEFAIAHELYHHREAIGEIEVLPARAEREAAADAFAREMTAAR